MKTKKNKQTFMTWDEWCLLKLAELGRSTLQEWGEAMGLNHPNSLCRVAKRLGDKVKITEGKSRAPGRLKFYEVEE